MDLGSGIYIAMQDLDIRAGSNMLGANRGFHCRFGIHETYQKILAEAVKELKGMNLQTFMLEELQAAGEEK